MTEAFLKLSPEEQATILQWGSNRFGRSARVLEKDVWVCWVLQHLFLMPARKQMAFKGGTSLSKVYRVINRFSEDVDITIDFRSLESGIDPYASGLSKSQQRRLGEQLKCRLQEHVHEIILPYFKRILADHGMSRDYPLELSAEGEKLRFHYPSAMDKAGDYLDESVLIEFGGRNIIEPYAVYEIAPDLATLLKELDFPLANVAVLSPARTFWEKATLIHVECHRPGVRSDASRLSRHWYDLTMLACHDIGKQALANRELLADVVRHKKIFFDAAYANYELCLTGRMRLIPEDGLLYQLERDYARMVEAGMFYHDYPAFDEIIGKLRQLEQIINAAIT